ncbi:MAG: DUF4157 domain-containing protein [Chitinophagaceae bacterium]|nr:DUF4157 domain-containing protein [Chitinophagaceae bacterium]
MTGDKKQIQKADNSNAAAVVVQCSLAIGAVNDPLEQEADNMADKVMSMQEVPAPAAGNASGIQRKCAACEEEEKVQRKPLASFIQRKEATGGMVASPTVTSQINATKGQGSMMDSTTQSFMESRFGTDFSNINIHTGGEAIQMSRDLNAKAFTVGNDIYFNEAQYNPNSSEGKHLLAHELTHTVQQGGDFQKKIDRKLSVTDASNMIPNPTGKGLVQTNRDTVLNYLQTLCTGGNVTISAGGDVSVPSYFCSTTPYPPDFVGPIPLTASTSGTPVGCGCLCDIITSPNSWRITVDDSSWPHTLFDDNTKADTPGSGGSGGEVTTPSPNSPLLWGAVTAAGGFQNIDPWLVLGHELCGHGWLGNKGDAAKDHTAPRGRGGHQETVERENLIRDEHGISRRGTFRQPYCGESFSHPTGTTASAGTVTMSSFLNVCKKWRAQYNKLNSTSFKISDQIPFKPGEKLPP